MGDTAKAASSLAPGGPQKQQFVKNHGLAVSTLSFIGICAMGIQGLLLNEGLVRSFRGILDGALALFWLITLIAFWGRPSLNRYSSYSRFSSIAGTVILAFAFAYGAMAAWFGEDYALYAAFVTAGFVLSRVSRRVRWALELVGAAALTLLGVYAHGMDSGLYHIVFILVPLALSEAASQAVERMKMEGEISLRDLKSRNEELEELAYRDPLTQLYNRRFGFESLRRAISFAQRYGGELHLLVLDIDHFKRVNDALGHPIGDEVLIGLARILQSSLRESDIASRIGGEEFLVIIPGAHAEDVQEVANRVRDIMASTSFPSVPWRVTVSIGVASRREADTAESLFSRADRFLYDAKRGGRNRVTGS